MNINTKYKLNLYGGLQNRKADNRNNKIYNEHNNNIFINLNVLCSIDKLI